MSKTNVETYQYESENSFGTYKIKRPAEETDAPIEDKSIPKKEFGTKAYFTAIFDKACENIDHVHKLEVDSWKARFAQAISEKEAIYAILMSEMTATEKKEAAALIHTDSSSLVKEIEAQCCDKRPEDE